MSIKIDLIIIGNSGTGKTSLIQKFIYGEDQKIINLTTTLGINVEKKKLMIKNKEVNLHIWDTAGQERFFALTKAYFQRADGVLLVYDVNDRQSFDKVESYWMPQISDKIDKNVKRILIGNKIDLAKQNRQVETKEGFKLSKKYGIEFYEASAQTNTSVQEAFNDIILQCFISINSTFIKEEKQQLHYKQQSRSSSCLNYFHNVFKNK